MHAGQFAILEEVVRHYVKTPPASVGRSELAAPERMPIRLTESEVSELVAVLGALSPARSKFARTRPWSHRLEGTLRPESG